MPNKMKIRTPNSGPGALMGRIGAGPFGLGLA